MGGLTSWAADGLRFTEAVWTVSATWMDGSVMVLGDCCCSGRGTRDMDVVVVVAGEGGVPAPRD